MNNNHIIRPKQLTELLGLSRTTIWRMENRGELPPRIQLSSGTVGWLASDIEDWFQNRPEKNGIYKNKAE